MCGLPLTALSRYVQSPNISDFASIWVATCSSENQEKMVCSFVCNIFKAFINPIVCVFASEV